MLTDARALIEPLIEPAHPQVSIARQCALLGIARSSWYSQPTGESAENLRLMRLLDEQYTQTPFYGVARMTAWLRQQGHAVNEKRVRRLLRLMGVEAIYPKPRLSVPGQPERRYPYLLRGISLEHADQVWSTDITYIRLHQGFVYLVAIVDWHSRYVLAWEVSNTLDTAFCLAALERALEQGQPTIFNTDQGVQFTSQAFTERLERAGIQISWDGRGRALDNIIALAAVALGQIRGGLPARLRQRGRSGQRPEPLLPLLQRQASASSAGLSHPGPSLWGAPVADHTHRSFNVFWP